MATNGQLRAALAILCTDVDAVAEQVWGRTTAGDDTAGIEQAMLAGLLYRVVGAQLRQSLANAPDVASLENRARAAGPSGVAVRGEDEYGQAHFEAYWLTDRIAELYGSLDSVPPQLAAAAYTAEASRTLLRIHRETLHSARPDAAHAGWESVLGQLDRARALARAAHAEAETVPQRGIIRTPAE
ncbi:hypothetical protein KO481_39120 [Nocardia sp. NEAU-G5]|uniref:Uncharacterized protein n=1 Tax=Nocardia albiluteola TaxID=2842303 RepID=A0ABS6BB54_9NOCA|nr:hypothetical protein [Nocardia albiluteola]MBU3067521.1 hypothetical protein [Nocardia albiluteola]